VVFFGGGEDTGQPFWRDPPAQRAIVTITLLGAGLGAALGAR
jgi:hypothetical protein